ncbi:FG-GAP repeat domain-containing protein [Polyangium mundeleinium]|uniref:FG-GAP repeat domain-containing protein n=1 Tax=Polyangium mundeleinium TaxID=2995306 RepID=UPI00358DAB13
MTNWLSRDASIALNEGGGVFSVSVMSPFAQAPDGALPADMDGDGDNDVVVTRGTQARRRGGLEQQQRDQRGAERALSAMPCGFAHRTPGQPRRVLCRGRHLKRGDRYPCAPGWAA